LFTFGKSARYTRKYTLRDACRHWRRSFRWQNHFHYFALRPRLLTADRVGVNVHRDVAIGVAHQRLHCLHILIILGEKRRKCVTEYVPTDVLGDLGPFRCRSDVIPLDSFRPNWLTPSYVRWRRSSPGLRRKAFRNAIAKDQ